MNNLQLVHNTFKIMKINLQAGATMMYAHNAIGKTGSIDLCSGHAQGGLAPTHPKGYTYIWTMRGAMIERLSPARSFSFDSLLM